MFGEHEIIDLFSDSKPGSERFVEKFLAIHDSGEVAPDQVLAQILSKVEQLISRCGKEPFRPSSWKVCARASGRRIRARKRI